MKRVFPPSTCFGMNRVNTRMKICTDLPLLFPHTDTKSEPQVANTTAQRVDTRSRVKSCAQCDAHRRYKNHIGFMLSLCFDICTGKFSCVEEFFVTAHVLVAQPTQRNENFSSTSRNLVAKKKSRKQQN